MKVAKIRHYISASVHTHSPGVDRTDWFGQNHPASSQLLRTLLHIKNNRFDLIFDQHEVKRRLVEKKEKGSLSPLMVIHSDLNRRN